MLVSIALTAATVCTARACTKRLDETQWPETRDETYWAETETYCSETETRPRQDVSTSRDGLETETSRPRRLYRDRIPACNKTKHVPTGRVRISSKIQDFITHRAPCSVNTRLSVTLSRSCWNVWNDKLRSTSRLGMTSLTKPAWLLICN